MKFIKALMGRRQFLMGAVATSTLGLASRKIANAFTPGTATSAMATGVAQAAENSEAAGMQGVFSDRYSHLLKPLKIGNVILKNRLYHTRSIPHFLEGPEIFPSEQVLSHYASVAKNGCAVITCKAARRVPRVREKLHGDTAHMMIWDINNPSVQNYFSQLADAIHFYGSLASVGIFIDEPEGYTISNTPMPGRFGMGSIPGKEIPVEMLQSMIEDAASQCKMYQSLGFDMVNIYMSYRASMLAYALSPAFNKRTDKYGGSLENRARFPLEMFQGIKKACGPDFLVEAQVSGEEPPGGFTIKDVVEYAKVWEGALDIIQLRAVDGDASHPSGLNSVKEHPVTLSYAEAIKKSGAKVFTAPVGGYQDLDLNNEFIASGKTDIIAMARNWICDPEYGKKAYEGRGEDVVPCIRCNDCHGISMEGPWYSWCSVNPKTGHAHRMLRMIDPPRSAMKIAVIGGGPAGMKAALTAAQRGHKVTVYERTDFLGGQISHSDFDPHKWPLKDFKDYLIRQIHKAGVEVNLMVRATPEMIKAKGYDAVIVALGADPVIPDIPGADRSIVRPPIFVYGNEKALGKRVVVIGGRQIGTETAIYLAQHGHDVTVLTEDRSLAPDANQIHFVGQLRNAWEALPNFKFVTGAKATEITAESVAYVDAGGAKHSIKTDNVVIYAGRKPRHEEALKFYGSAKRFFIVGDCHARGIILDHADGNVAKSVRTAFGAASEI